MFISAPELEVPFVKRWVEALRSAPHAPLRDTPILVRPHPYNGWIWADVDMSAYPGVAVWPRGTYNPVDAGTRDDFFDSLFYSRAVVGINTSAMVEASIIGRPVHSIVTDDFARTQEGTLHFHHLLPEHGGFLQVGRGFAHHADLLAASLADEDAARAQTERFVSWFIRPHGLDRDCTPIFADALERVASWPVRPDAAAVGGVGARLAAAVVRPFATVLMHRPPRDGTPGLVDRVRRAFKDARKRARQRRKEEKAATKKAAAQAARTRRAKRPDVPKDVAVGTRDSGA